MDARHRRSERRKPRLLLEEAVEIALHRGQFAFCDADLVLRALALMMRDGSSGLSWNDTMARVMRRIGRTMTKYRLANTRIPLITETMKR